MKQILLISFFTLILLNQTYSQENAKISHILNLKAMPLSLFGDNPRYRIGLEYIAKNNFGYGIDIGYGNSQLNQWWLSNLQWGKDYSYVEIRPEIKYLAFNRKDYFLYGAIEFLFAEMNDYLESGEYQKEDIKNGTSYESARFMKRKTGFHLKAGFNAVALKRLNFDFYGGLGFVKRTISYTDVVNPRNDRNIFVEWIPQPHLFEGEMLILHATLGLKVGYTFPMKQKITPSNTN